MADKDIELDDFDLDEFNFDEFDIDSSDAVDDRKPTTIIKDSAIEGFKGSLKDKNVVRNALERSLPKEYESSFEALDAVGDAKEQLKDAMEPVAKQAKGLARQNKALIDKFLPKKMAEKLVGWSENEDSGGGYENIDPREAEVSASLADIFRLNQEKESETREVDDNTETERFAIKEEAETKRHMSQVEVLEAIRSGITRQTDYQDQVLTKYQQKHLELTYRQLYTFQDILELGKRQAESDNKSLAEIVKNTGLPETQKIRAFEEAKREIQADLRREAVEGVGGYVKGIGGKLVGNTINTVKDRLTNTMSSLQDTMGMTDGMDESPLSMVANMLGSSGGQALMEKGISAALKKMGQDADESNVKRLGSRLALMLQEAPEKLLAWSQSESGRTGPAGFFERFIKDQMPSFGRIDKVSIEQIADADEAATFTNRVARAITDVIPGYLSLQLHQLRLLVADGQPIDKIEYNPETGQFTAAEEKTKTVQDRLFSGASDKYQRNMKEAVDGLLGDADVTDDQRKELENFLYDQLSKGKTAEIKELPKAIGRSEYIQEDNKKLLSDILTKNVYDSSGKHYDSATVQNTTRETYGKIGDLRESIPYIQETIEKMLGAGYRDDMIKMGLIDTQGKIDHDVVAEHLSGRPIAKRGQDGTFKTRVASGHSNAADDTDVALRGVQNTRPDIQDRRTTPFKTHTLQQTPQASKEIEDAVRHILDVVSPMSEATVQHLPMLLSGQTTQTDHFNELIQGLSTPKAQTTMTNADGMDAVRKVIEDCCIKTEAAEQIELLKQILAIIPESATIGGGPNQANGSVFKSIVSRVGKVAKGASDGLQTYYKGAFGLMEKAVETAGTVAKPVAEGAGGLLRSIGQRLTQGKAEIEKLYVEGKAGAAIYMSKLKAGEYVDALTGKTLWTLEELKAAKGEIHNKAGEVVLTAEDLAKGLYDKHGKGIITKGKDFLKKYYETLWGGAKGLLGVIPPTARAAYGFAKGILTRQQDLYVRGEGTPRILANLLQKGHYRSQATGKAVYTYADIDGSIIDPDGRVVLSMEELEKVVGADGKPIRTLTEKGVDLVKAYYGTLWKATKGAGKFVGDVATNLKDRFMDKTLLGGMGEEQAERTWSYWDEQLAILRRLDLRFTDGPTEQERPEGAPSPEGPPPHTPTTTPSESLALPAPDGYVAPQGTQTPTQEDADFSKPALGTPSKTPTSGGSDVLGSVTEKFTGAMGSIKDSFSKYFSKSTESEEEHDKDRDQQIGILTKLTDMTGKRTEKLDELQQSQLDSQTQMTKTLKGIEENTEKDELRSGGWKERLAGNEGDSREGSDDEDDEPKLGKASKTLGYEKKSMADVLFGPFGGIVEKFGEYMGMFKGAVAGLTGWISAKLLGGAATTAAGTAADVATSGGKKGIMGRLWGGIKTVAKKGASLAVKAAPLALGAAKVVGGALATGASAVGSVLSAPVVLGAVAVAGLAYGGYKLYQYATRYKSRILDKLRYAHYGLNIDEEKSRTLVMPLEAYLEDNLSWENGSPKVNYNPKDETLSELLGLDGENDELDRDNAFRWFRDRFVPVWGTHRALLRNVYNDEVALGDIDDLKTHQKQAFLSKLASAVPSRVFGDMTSPFMNDTLAFNAAQVNAMHHWAKKELGEEESDTLTPLTPLKPMGEKSPSTSSFPEYDYDGNITRIPNGNQSGVTGQTRSSGGGSYWGGFSAKALKESVASSRSKSPYILSIKRYKQTAQSTISDAALIDKGTGDKVLEFKFLERPGPDTKESNQRLRIPEGSYKLKWQTSTGLAGVRPHLPVPWIYGNGVAENRHIYIHNGNYPRQTDGCLLCGKDEAPNMVTSSVDTLDRLKTELQAIGIENVTVEISSAYAGGQKAPTTTTPAAIAATASTKAAPTESNYGEGETWSPEQTAMRAMAYQPGVPDDGRGQSPIDRPEKASDREEALLATMPEDWVGKDEVDATEAALKAQHPDKTDRQIRTLTDIELTRLTNQRKGDWLSENGISAAAAKSAGVLGDATQPGPAKVRSYGPLQESLTPAVFRPEAPAVVDEKPTRTPVSTEAETEQDIQESRDAEKRAQTQREQREQSNLTQRVDKERRHTLETASRIESVLGEQLTTQRRMSDNLDKLVLLAEGRFQQDTNKSPAEYLVKRGYRPPQGQKEAFKPIVDLSS